MGMVAYRYLMLAALCVAFFASNGLGQAAQLSLGKNIGLSLSQQAASNNADFPLSLNAPFIFGLSSGEDSPGQKQSLVVDLSASYIYVPSSATSGFGITCDDSSKCSVTGQVGPQNAYQGVDANGAPATTLLRFSSGKLKESSYPAPLQFIFSTFLAPWTNQFGNNGLFGFGPTSQLWNFVSQTYSPTKDQNYYDFSFYLVARDPSKLADPSSVKFDGSQVTVNGRYTSKEQVISSQANTALGAWYFPGATVQPWTKFGNPNIPNGICIDSGVHALILLSDVEAANLRLQISQQLCGQDDGCNSDNSKISGVSPIVFNFPGANGDVLQVSVPPSGFITMVNNKAVIAVTTLDKSNFCKNSPVSVGRLLLAFTEITVRMQVDSNKNKTFYLGASKVKLSSKWFYFWLFFALAMLLVFIFTAIFVVRNYTPNRKYFENNADAGIPEEPRTLSD